MNVVIQLDIILVRMSSCILLLQQLAPQLGACSKVSLSGPDRGTHVTTYTMLTGSVPGGVQQLYKLPTAEICPPCWTACQPLHAHEADQTTAGYGQLCLWDWLTTVATVSGLLPQLVLPVHKQLPHICIRECLACLHMRIHNPYAYLDTQMCRECICQA